jgi:hypothetical protein
MIRITWGTDETVTQSDIFISEGAARGFLEFNTDMPADDIEELFRTGRNEDLAAWISVERLGLEKV